MNELTKEQLDGWRRVCTDEDGLLGINKRDLFRLLAERDRLAAVVEKLPKTADGVPVVPGMTVYLLDREGDPVCEALVTTVTNYKVCGAENGEESFRTPMDDCCYEHCDASTPTKECYATRDAALAALQKETSK